MTDLVELAAKCRNPVVRNALLAAAGGNGLDAARKTLTKEQRCVTAERQEAATAHELISDEIERRGLFGERNAMKGALIEYLGIVDADKRLFMIERALRALRRAGRAQTHHGGAARP